MYFCTWKAISEYNNTWKHFVSKLGLCDCGRLQRQCDNIICQHDIVLTISNITKPGWHVWWWWWDVTRPRTLVQIIGWITSTAKPSPAITVSHHAHYHGELVTLNQHFTENMICCHLFVVNGMGCSHIVGSRHRPFSVQDKKRWASSGFRIKLLKPEVIRRVYALCNQHKRIRHGETPVDGNLWKADTKLPRYSI